ncbi:CAP domain-containing protein, partial [Planktotalea sp.]|uniref:CAP domain-containing protein n=1 Tax=Planktotalea sp. TaxID=2029877 RepID=UPI0025EAE98F
DMLAQNYFSHDGKDGSTIGSCATAAGYNWTSIGENIAQGQANENLAMNGWVSSPGHQRNNVDPDFKEFGLGRTGSGANTRWTLVLGAQ